MLKQKKLIMGIGSILLLFIVWWLVSPTLFNKVVDEPLPQNETVVSEEAKVEEVKAEEAKAEEAKAEEMKAEEVKAEEVREYKGIFMNGVRNYKTSGSVTTIVTGTTAFLRFEDFETTNGPDLFVYLVKPGLKTGEGINLGVLKGNKGNQNYEVPKNIDLSEYNKVVIWCKAFDSDFGFAELK